jgi:tRNA pseudouridine55 synthase
LHNVWSNAHLPVEPNQLDGLLVVNKPGKPGLSGNAAATESSAERLWTSHDVVARVRRLSNQRRIGHTGTLDPMASGVLVLCLGIATRLVEYYQGEDKRYYAEIVLGYATDTYDGEGKVTEMAPVPVLAQADLERGLAPFRGEIWQTPPAYSAIKQEGVALYARARRGEEVTVVARRVTFHSINLIDFRPPDRLLLAIHCSAGAYIRSLAYDLGRSLGTLATLDVLRREAVGSFSLADAVTLEQIGKAAAHGALADLLHKLGDGLPLPQVQLTAELRRRLAHGQHLPLAHAACPIDCTTGQPLVQVRDEMGNLAGIMRCLQPPDDPSDPASAALWKAEKWLN